MGQYLDLKAADGFAVRSYIAEPIGRPHAAVIVLQEKDNRHLGFQASGRQVRPAAKRFGVGAATRAETDFLAASGYLAIAPSTFNRGTNGTHYGYRYEEAGYGLKLRRPLQALHSPLVMLDIAAAVLHGQRNTLTTQVALVGFCWGGLLAWRAAATLADIKAVACHDGGGMTQAEERILKPLCPVLAHFSQDRAWTAPDTLEAFAETQSAPQVQIHHYDARYGFGLQRGNQPDAAQAQLARSRTLDFLATHLPLF